MTTPSLREIADFLGRNPPFDLLGKDLLDKLVSEMGVQYRPQGDVIFRQGELPNPFIYIVREGSVDLHREGAGGRELVDRCDEGELFGLRSLLAEDTYALTAIAAETTLLLTLPEETFRDIAETTPKMLLFIAANFASGWEWRKASGIRNKLPHTGERPTEQAFQLLEVQSMERAKSPVVCSADRRIREAATIMTEHEVGSIVIVDDRRCPLGILTDKDLRRRVATGEVPIEAPVTAIMSRPVRTAHPAVSVADVQMEMVRHRISHLCLTEDGSDSTPIVGVFTEHDLLIVQGNNPAVFLREIKRTRQVEELLPILERSENLLKQYLQQEVAIGYVASIITEINDTLLRQVLRLAEARLHREGYQRPETDYCWLGLGSEGRRERLLRTDQDNALIFADVAKEQYEETKAYYLRLAQAVNEALLTCGFIYCPGEMMAGNPKWCLSLGEWKRRFTAWILEPSPMSIMHSTVFFDYRPISGVEQLAQQLADHIVDTINEQEIFFIHLAKSAMENPPPLTFFRDIMVERSGEYKNQFDIKKRAMTPLIDAARVLALHKRFVKSTNTSARFLELARLEPANRELYEEAAAAYEILIRFRTLQGIKNGNSGRYFHPNELSKMDRILLRNIFRPIQEVQTLLKTRFQLAFF